MKIIVILTFCFACAYAAPEFSGRARNFSLELLQFTQLETDGHIVISPFGIWTLLTGIALGASGKSKTQISHALFLPRNQKAIINGYANLTETVLDPTSPDVQLASKNFMFLDRDFHIYPEFQSVITNDFNAMIRNLNFKDPSAAAQTANALISNSGAKVSNVLTSDDFTNSRLILTNAITFRGLWQSPFNKTDTSEEKFYNEDNKEIGRVNMMYQRGQLPFSNIKELKSLVMELPYGKEGKYVMLVVLPYPKVKVYDVYQQFQTVTFSDIFTRLQEDVDNYGLEDVDIKLPRFKISTNVVMNGPLIKMGVVDIFDPNKASFERISPESIYVSAIVHKADIEVTESGTVASAETSAYFADRISTPRFNANRPFLYFIMEKATETVIFSGIYSKPSVF
ncbi:unnamed protein product [Pieris macdunnoughi]|uniref:Serpin domain-containing protein n=1 Tax=Pieris macdunnoughi TaxID=345717 RepID=A0A821XAD8_9NEOP|nr:unnamed protein product [Pieris macdunnoughi]